MGHYENRVAAGKVDPTAGVDTVVDEQIDNTLTRINATLQKKFGGGTAKSMLTGLEQFEENLEGMADHKPLLAMSNGGSPAKALGAGSSSSESDQLDEQKALELLWNSAKLNSNVQTALKRLFAPVGDPDRIEVDDKGNDKRLVKSNSEVTKLTKERDDAKAAKAKAEQDLANEKAKPGTTPTPAPPAKDMIEKAKVKAAFETFATPFAKFATVGNLPPNKEQKKARDDAKAALDQAKRNLGL